VSEAERRLTTIVAADIAGFSSLVGADEEGTLAAQRSHRTELIDPLIKEYHGRIANTAGDSLLVEFPSAVEAVRCSNAVQEGMAERNRDVPIERRIQYRIGINLGDVVAEGDDLLGDGVNVAARLEGLAKPGGICISRMVRDSVRDRLEIALEDMGEVEVKNIARPVRVFRVLAEGEAATAPRRQAPTPRWFVAAAVMLLIAVAGGGAGWWWAQQRDFESANPAKMVYSLPDKPSIAVLRFDNLSNDSNQKYFADGMAEDVITDLSKISGLFVIARNSSFSIKDTQADVRTIASKFGVKYILEGSVRRDGDQVRINAQLIDATTGGHLWAERYDRHLNDIFEVQDEITRQIVAALQIELTETEHQRVASRYTNNLLAYDAYLLAKSFRSDLTKEKNEQARHLLERAVELDPKFAAAYAELAWVHAMAWISQWTKGIAEEVLQAALALAQKAVTLNDTLPEAHARLAWIYLYLGTYEQAIAEARRAIDLDPNYADGYLLLSHILIYAGQPAEGIRVAEAAMPLDPDSMYHSLMHLADGQWMLGQHKEAIANFERSVALRPEFTVGHVFLAAINGHLGLAVKARVAAERVSFLITSSAAGTLAFWADAG